MVALSLTDLTPITGEPRLRDLRLAEALGFTRRRKIRDLISAHYQELLAYGSLPRIGAMVAAGSGVQRAVEEFWLNEPQCLLICMFAQTDNAAAVRKQAIELFVVWRHGEQVRSSSEDQTVVVLRRLEARLDALEATGHRLAKLSVEPYEASLALTHAVELWCEHKRAARPRFWGDTEVRGLVLSTYRQMTIDQARAFISERFGDDRTPSRSSIGRFWQQLDRLRTDTPSLKVH